MIPWTLLDTAEVPVEGGELRLLQRGAEFSIRLGHNELMNSRVHASEDALAKIACARIGAHARPRILIAGLGVGFTLRATRGAVGEEARVVVAELPIPLCRSCTPQSFIARRGRPTRPACSSMAEVSHRGATATGAAQEQSRVAS